MEPVLRRYIAVPAIALLLFAVACSSSRSTGSSGSASGGSTAAGGSGDVNATDADFSITLGTSTASAGAVAFAIHNDGPSAHEFVVLQTNLDPTLLPTTSDGTVDVKGNGIKLIGAKNDVAPGTDTTLDTNLAAGSYVVICNLPGHYQQGMHAPLTVS